MAPALLPQVAGESPALAGLRRAVEAAVAGFGSDSPVTIIAPGTPGGFPPSHGGDLGRFGRPEAAVPGVPADLPWPAVLGRLLLAAQDLPAGDALTVDGSKAAVLPDGPLRVMVLGDGTACRTTAAPGGFHPDAAAADAEFAAALGSGEPAALAAVHAAPSLLVAGVPAWRAVGLALAHRGLAWSVSPVTVTDPLGVGSFVAVWTAP
jgi:hypothetical protein